MLKCAVLFVLASVCCVQAEMKDMLLNYGFERVRLTNACKSRIIDFVKSNDFDSLQKVMKFCDSINQPNPDWLSNSDRFFLEVISENWALLKKDSFYIATFNLIDSESADLPYPGYDYPNFVRQTRYRLYDRENCLANPSPVPENEDLSRFLRLLYDEKLAKLKAKMPAESYMWDFFDLLFPPEKARGRTALNVPSKRYLKKYPDSPFYRLVLINFYFNFKPSGNGAAMGIGVGYQSFDNKTSALLADRVNVVGYFDLYLHRFPYKLGLTVISQRLSSPLAVGKDTIPSKTSMVNLNWFLGTGYLFHLGDQFHVTPYGGLSIFTSFLTDTVQKDLNINPSIPALYGLQIGTTLQYQFNPSYNEIHYGWRNDASMWGTRLDVGVILTNFSQLKPGLGSASFYANIGLEIMGFAQDRIFEVRK